MVFGKRKIEDSREDPPNRSQINSRDRLMASGIASSNVKAVEKNRRVWTNSDWEKVYSNYYKRFCSLGPLSSPTPIEESDDWGSDPRVEVSHSASNYNTRTVGQWIKVGPVGTPPVNSSSGQESKPVDDGTYGQVGRPKPSFQIFTLGHIQQENPQPKAGKIPLKPGDPRLQFYISTCLNNKSLKPEQAEGKDASASCTQVRKDLLNEGTDQQKGILRREVKRNELLAARKLCLIIDLDHILLHHAMYGKMNQDCKISLEKEEAEDMEKPQRHLFYSPHFGIWIKLRPGIWNFMDEVSKLYELHLSTRWSKEYAVEVVKMLDPTGALFAKRIMYKRHTAHPSGGNNKLPKSKELGGILGNSSQRVIIDSTVKDWSSKTRNLIVLRRYYYFPCKENHFESGQPLLRLNQDERPEEGCLSSILGILKRIHQDFFSKPSLTNVDVTSILALEQKKVLAGCHILFSGFHDPEKELLWKTAEQFGATYSKGFNSSITHVVAKAPTTDVGRALETLDRKVYAVGPKWFKTSTLTYRRANEDDFSLLEPILKVAFDK